MCVIGANISMPVNQRIQIACLSVTLLIAGSCSLAANARRDTNSRAKNDAALEKARKDIEKYRKGPIRLKVIDRRGKPVAGARVEIRQVSHAFKFGCYLKIDDLDPAELPNYEQRFRKLFNYAVIGNYWDNVEYKQNEVNWTWFDREVALSIKLGIEIQAAPMLWGTSEYGTPKWLPTSKGELLPILENRVRSSVTRNPSVTDWEVVNEPLAPNADFFADNVGQEYIATAFRWAKDAAPEKRLIINEYGVFGSISDHNYNRQKYFELVEKLIRNQVPIDIIGIQAHANGEWYEPRNVAEQLEKYASLGKPIQITEFSGQTHDFNDRKKPLAISGGHQDDTWNAEKQAEFYHEFYTVAFANPSVEAIITWGLDDRRAWLPGIGLLDENGQPKPSYAELDRLINQAWKTRLDGTANEDGIYELKGFFGDYEIKVNISSGKRLTAKFKLVPGKVNEWVINSGA